MIKTIGVINIILLSLYSPFLSGQLSHNRFPVSVNERIFNNLLPALNLNPGKSNNFIRLDSLTVQSITVFSYSKHKFQYNINNLMSEQLVSSYIGNEWENIFKSNYFYDGQDNLIQAYDLDRNSNGWDSTYSTAYFYENGFLSRQEIQTYTNPQWINTLNTLFTYTPSGNIETTLEQVWAGSSWNDLFLSTRYYSEPGKVDSIIFQIPAGAGWQNDKKSVFYYTANGTDVDSIISGTWSNEHWVNLVRRNITNDEHHDRISVVDQDWINNEWINTSRLKYTYNAEHYIESIYGEAWENNNWVSYDVDMVFQNPDGFTIGFIGANEVHGYYSSITGVSEEDGSEIPGSFSLLQNYPNPFNPATTITYSISERSLVNLKVFDILGKEIATLVNGVKEAGTYSTIFNASDYPGGVYFYKMTANGRISVKKMILLK